MRSNGCLAITAAGLCRVRNVTRSSNFEPATGKRQAGSGSRNSTAASIRRRRSRPRTINAKSAPAGSTSTSGLKCCRAGCGFPRVVKSAAARWSAPRIVSALTPRSGRCRRWRVCCRASRSASSLANTLPL
uniref:Phage terminase GpA n=1 Tax=uncultured marine virus TaxID=186617 RepID=A0A0F7L938_9VIRU|nr:phage terminase GpA [uncultured marine virus]